MRVELAQREKITREFRGDEQTNIFKIRGIGLIAGLSCFDAATAPAEDVELIVDGERKRVTVLRDWAKDSETAVGRAIAGKALALRRKTGRKLRELGGDLHGGEGASLFEASYGNFDGLVGL